MNGMDTKWSLSIGQVVEEKKGFFASIVAFFLSLFSLISDLYAIVLFIFNYIFSTIFTVSCFIES